MADNKTHLTSPSRVRNEAFSSTKNKDTGGKKMFSESRTEAERLFVAEWIKMYRASTFEDEICLDPQTDLQKYYDECEKDPAHKSFKPCDAFTIKDLPEKYQSEELMSLIKSLNFLTVQVIVEYISHKRPLNGRYTTQELYEKLGTAKLIRFGSGKINKVTQMTGKACPCNICKSSSPKKSWHLIEIYTARHVVYDQSEAQNTACKFGYSSYSSNIHEWSCIGAKISQTLDWCKLRCVTHDASLVEKIQENLTCYSHYTKILYQKYRTAKKLPKLAIIISHPHGCYKQISVGFLRKRAEAGGLDIKYTYTTSTCKGSSGALVYILGRDGKLGLFTHIHCGWDPDSPLKDNFSCPVND